MDGFFGDSPKKQLPTIRTTPNCKACGRMRDCKSPKLGLYGSGAKGILIISESPGRDEDAQGQLMVGNSSQELDQRLRKHGIVLRRDCWLTNAVICHSKSEVTPEVIDHCRPHLVGLLQELKPKVIITLGEAGLRSVLPLAWRDEVGVFTRWPGWRIPSQALNAWICPTYHPSYLFKAREETVALFFDRHLRAATEIEEAPYPSGPPNLEKQVDIILDDEDAARMVRKIIARGGLTAFDYEATCIKPDGPRARLLSAAICWEGRKTIAFLWRPRVAEAMVEYVTSPMPKIAANMKYEDRWTRIHLGTPVRGWVWDTMLNAHLLDNRPQITGLKFQSFVLLGQPDYNSHIEPYMKSAGSNLPNQLHKLEAKPLLLYNGLDAVLEYWVAIKQMEKLKWKVPTTFSRRRRQSTDA